MLDLTSVKKLIARYVGYLFVLIAIVVSFPQNVAFGLFFVWFGVVLYRSVMNEQNLNERISDQEKFVKTADVKIGKAQQACDEMRDRMTQQQIMLRSLYNEVERLRDIIARVDFAYGTSYGASYASNAHYAQAKQRTKNEKKFTTDQIRAFNILGIKPGASNDDIQNAYKAKVRTAHPDHGGSTSAFQRSEEHTSELQSHHDLVCRLL